MNIQLLKILGQIAGIGGIAIGSFLIIGRNVLARKIFPRLTKRDATKVILSIAFMAWTIALAGIVSWTYVSVHGKTEFNNNDQKASGTVNIDLGVPVQSPSKKVSLVKNVPSNPLDLKSLVSKKSLVREDSNEIIRLSRPFEVKYSVSRENGVLNISPISPYLDAIKAGKTVSMVHWAPSVTPYFEWEYPIISLKASNSTTSPCYITEALIEVISSKINIEPILVAEGDFYGRVGIVNEGWGAVVNPKATLQLSDSRGGFIKKHVILTHDLYLDFSAFLSESEFEKAHKKGEERPFKASISYETENGTEKQFNCEGLVYFGPAPLPFVEPSREPYEVFLPAGKENYETIVPISQEIPAGGIDNFEICIGTDKSATFNLRIGFRTTSGEVIGTTSVILSTFISRTGKIPGPVHKNKWRKIDESFVCAGMRLTLSNVRFLKKSEFDHVFVAKFEALNEGSQSVWFPAGEDMSDDKPFLEIVEISLDHYSRLEMGSEKTKKQATLLKVGEATKLEFEFESPWENLEYLEEVLISMKLRGTRVIDEVVFQIPVEFIDRK